jgi:predicted nucleic-acid-binding protein
VIAVDTNIVVRFLVEQNDAGQRHAVDALMSAGGVLLLRTVVLETTWVLRSSYKFKPEDVVRGLRALMGLPGVEVEDGDRVRKAIEWHEAGLDFADALHLAFAGPAESFVTFDRNLIRKAKRLSGAPEVRAPA